MKQGSITAQELHRVLEYSPHTGRWFWRTTIAPHARAGKEAALTRDTEGFRRIQIYGRRYRAARLAIFFTTGRWPREVKHKNGLRDAGNHRPHYAREPEAVRDARAAARDAYIERTVNTWRTHRDGPQPDLATSPQELRRHLRSEPDDDAQAGRDRAWADYCDRVSNAWRTDPRAANAIERQGERWRGGR